MINGTIPTELAKMTILEDLSLEKNLIVGKAPPEVCALREKELNMFVTDCPSTRREAGVLCPIPDCCSFCRRSD
jgi:hypothetical protein